MPEKEPNGRRQLRSELEARFNWLAESSFNRHGRREMAVAARKARKSAARYSAGCFVRAIAKWRKNHEVL